MIPLDSKTIGVEGRVIKRGAKHQTCIKVWNELVEGKGLIMAYPSGSSSLRSSFEIQDELLCPL